MPAALKVDWETIERRARSGETLEVLAKEYHLSPNAVKSRSMRFGWKIQFKITQIKEKHKGMEGVRAWLKTNLERIKRQEDFLLKIQERLNQSEWMETEKIHLEIKKLVKKNHL